MTLLLRNDRANGILISFFVHTALFLCGGLILAKPIEYAVELGSGGVELNLVAAPTEPLTESTIAVEALPESIEQTEETIPEPVAAPLPPRVIEEKKIVEASAGKDATTFYSAGGAMTEAKPNYLKNPAPPYPMEARQKGWEGVVILKVAVNSSGRSMRVEIEQSAGHTVLDEAAIKAVKTWRFRPAQMGALSVDSSARVPIRFELERAKTKNKAAVLQRHF